MMSVTHEEAISRFLLDSIFSSHNKLNFKISKKQRSGIPVFSNHSVIQINFCILFRNFHSIFKK